MYVEGTYLGYKIVVTRKGAQKAIADVYGGNGLVRVMCDVDAISGINTGDKIKWAVETNNLVFSSSPPAVVK
ncbi:MAG: hypothetical protein QXT77_09045 [Candidatus Methanomethylicaceae archaeon]